MPKAKTAVESPNLAKVVLLIERISGVDPSEITKNASLVDDLQFDDLDLVELCMAVEEEFGFDEIDEDTAEGFKKVSDIVKFIDARAKQ